MNAQIKRWTTWAAAVVVAGSLAGTVQAEVKARKVLAIGSVNDRAPEGRNGRNTINFFDVTDVAPGAADIFNNSPLFSVFIGFDYFQGYDPVTGAPITGDEEDAGAFTVNPVNGTMYTMAFNQFADKGGLSTPAYGANRSTNDTMGDFDLFRIDYQAILKDWTDNNRPHGVIYAPEYATTTVAIEQVLEFSLDPRWDGNSDGRARHVPHPESFTLSMADTFDPETIWLPGAIEKIGEVGRAPTDHFGGGGGQAFFNQQIEFINPETLLRLDGSSADTPEGDHQIRAYKRVSKTPGLAIADLDGPDNVAGTQYGDAGGFVNDDLQGGFNQGTTESWESYIIGRPQMDPTSRSDVLNRDWAMVKTGGVMGVWIFEDDGANAGDELAFFEIDFSTPMPTVLKKDLFTSGGPPAPNSLKIAEDPSVDPLTTTGEVDNILVDAAGNLVIVESGFPDSPQTEPRTFTMLVSDYDAADSDGDGVREVLPGGPAGTGFNDTAAWTTPQTVNVTGDLDDDTAVTDSRFVAYDRGTGYVYIVDPDNNPAPFAGEDIYVFDPATGTIVYHELSNVPLTKSTDPAIMNKATLLLFTRGDVNEDGTVNGTDIDLMFAAINDPTLGGTVTPELGKEWYDLTGDGDLTSADADAMIRGILGTEYGDFNLDGRVDGDDLEIWQDAFAAGTEWESGDANGDGAVDGSDLMVWQRHVGFNNMAMAGGAVPEPGAVGLALSAMVGVVASSRRRSRQ